MANRELVRIGDDDGFYIAVERSARGRPTILISIGRENSKFTAVVPDAYELINPILEWLEPKS